MGAMASNAKKEKEKTEKERKKDLRTLKYFSTFEERLSSVEKAFQSQQVCQNHVENTIPPNQPNTKVNQDFIAVQKTEDKNTESSTEQQSELVPEASCDPSNVSIDTVQLSHVTGTKPLKKKTSHLKQRKYKLRMLSMKKKRIP